jgi:hypothetical protein
MLQENNLTNISPSMFCETVATEGIISNHRAPTTDAMKIHSEIRFWGAVKYML